MSGIIVGAPYEAGLGAGDSGGHLPGTGLSIPAGVEGIFEYNGLRMNVQAWADTYIVKTLSGFDDLRIRDTREDNPNDHGSTSLGSLYGDRTMTISGVIRAWTLYKLRDMVQAMRTAFADISQERPLIIHGIVPEQDVQIYCKKNQQLVIPEQQDKAVFERTFQIPLIASNPFFQSLQESYTPLTINALPTSAEIVNNGNWDQARLRFQLIGPITNPVITNLRTGKFIKLNATIATGQTWTIDSEKRQIFDQAGVNKFDAYDVTSDWVELLNGSNTIQLTGSGITAGITRFLIFNRHWWI
jgi:hypothetical protein